jgi:hypothetical protein
MLLSRIPDGKMYFKKNPPGEGLPGGRGGVREIALLYLNKIISI